jgi:hypothetical protein
MLLSGWTRQMPASSTLTPSCSGALRCERRNRMTTFAAEEKIRTWPLFFMDAGAADDVELPWNKSERHYVDPLTSPHRIARPIEAAVTALL